MTLDLLKGYSSDNSSSSSSSSNHDGEDAKAETPLVHAHALVVATPPPATAKPQPEEFVIPPSQKSQRMEKRGALGGKRMLSLGAVLPPEIFDRLTRLPRGTGTDDSSVSSFEGDDARAVVARPTKKRGRSSCSSCEDDGESGHAGIRGGTRGIVTGSRGVDRTGLNLLLDELRSTPLHASSTKLAATVSATASGDDGTAHLNKKLGATSDNEHVADKEGGGKLGMAFMSYTSSTTMTRMKKDGDVVDVHATMLSTMQPKSVMPKNLSPQASFNKEEEGGVSSGLVLPLARPLPSFSRMSAAAPVATTSLARTVKSQCSQELPDYPMITSQTELGAETSSASTTLEEPLYGNQNNNTGAPKSRKQRREEERVLRSGGAFRDGWTAEIHQPSPTEFAPTAHAAAIASCAARRRGTASGWGRPAKNIAMYDPRSGTDVKGLGVTGKHRSKHQINQLMASAISLEAHRASEAELARFGAAQGGGGSSGGGSSRADAKRKYGW